MMQLPLTVRGANNIEIDKGHLIFDKYMLIMYCKCFLQGLLQLIVIDVCRHQN